MKRSPSPALARFRARRKERRARRGVALIMVLGSLVVLTVLVTELGEQTSSTLSAALADRDSLKAEYQARSGVNLGRLLIATEHGVRQAFAPVWAMMGRKGEPPQIPVWKFSNMVLGPFNCAEKQEDFQRLSQAEDAGKNLGLTGGCFDLRIVDEDSKLNVNGAVRGDPFSRQRLGSQLLGLVSGPQYAPLFEQADADGQYSNQPVICGAIIDWTDMDEGAYGCDPFADQNSGSEGSEDNYYQTVGANYVRKNAAFDSLEELRLVRGVGDDFWATFIDPTPNDPSERVITVWGQDKLNVNTANAQTLLAVVCSGAPDAPLCNDPAQISAFLMAVTLAREVTQGAPIFTSPRGFVRAMGGRGRGIGALFGALGVEPVAFKNPKLVEKSVTTESRVFSLYVDGIVPGRQRETRVRIHSVVDFRSAVEIGAEVGDSDATANADPQAEAPPSNEPPSPEAIAAALASDPMGVIIYHRIE